VTRAARADGERQEQQQARSRYFASTAELPSAEPAPARRAVHDFLPPRAPAPPAAVTATPLGGGPKTRGRKLPKVSLMTLNGSPPDLGSQFLQRFNGAAGPFHTR
jgi:hypothetical protein